ncbi:Os03g0659450 [Oryza sativa Japonica Group]|uniref:Os03g0659450 protein n=1 Tax=Oryza sativa subsp. japonica TaxID=39947 RepID=A0A0N7KHR9_ORYSJ|nr:hypothetical protein EE612_019407 [Oryza sativa]BAS85585.1 Os03g0659450 [Oryza sativa Japonica Group]
MLLALVASILLIVLRSVWLGIRSSARTLTPQMHLDCVMIIYSHLSQKLSKQHLLVNTASAITLLHSRQWSSAGKSSTTLTDAAGARADGMPSIGHADTSGTRVWGFL